MNVKEDKTAVTKDCDYTVTHIEKKTMVGNQTITMIDMTGIDDSDESLSTRSNVPTVSPTSATETKVKVSLNLLLLLIQY